MLRSFFVKSSMKPCTLYHPHFNPFREMHSRNKKATELIAKGWSALKEVDRVIDYAELKDRRLIPLPRAAKENFELALEVDNSNTQARYWLSKLHLKYHVPGANKAIGAALLVGAADMGDSHAQYELGCRLRVENDYVQSDQQTFYYLEKAVGQLHPGALYLLGAVYLTGDCVKKDVASALWCFHRASEKGHAGAAIAYEALLVRGFEVPERNTLNTSMLDSIHKNHPFEALDIFKKQLQLGFPSNVDEVTVSVALKACRGNLKSGCQIHGFAISSGFILHVSVSNSLMNMYYKSGLFDQAFCIFDNLSNPDTVSWNTVLSGFQDSENALSFALRMNKNGVVFDAVSYTTVLAFCSNHEEFMFGLQLHSLIFRYGLDCEVFVGNALISMYSRWGRLVEAKRVFDEMSYRDLVSWNAMLSGYTQEGIYGLEAIEAFLEMVRKGMKLDHVSFTSVVSACGHERNLELGRQIHGLTMKTGYGLHVSVCNVLMSMYSKCEVTGDAKSVFKRMIERNVISWTTMISISEEDAVFLFNEMRMDGVYPNDVTFVGLIHGITMQNMVEQGRMIHGFCVKTSFLSELNVCNSFITMYAKFESMQDSMKVFEELSYREIISWNALISGFAQNRMCQEALHTFFSAMEESQPNEFTFGSILSAIAASEAISMRHGQRCHSHLIKLGLNTGPIVSGSLLDMYAKRGSILESQRVFGETPQRNHVTWTTIISAYASHGDYDSVMSLFDEMEKESVKPDSITFLSVLTACGRKGMVDMGRQIFDSMVNDHVIEPSPEHFSCMVDMLGRAGRLKEAEEFVGLIPGGPGLSVLQSLLGACRTYGNVEMGKKAADALMEMEPMGSGSYVLMSNLYAENNQWEKVAKIRKGMRERGVRKEIGFSWVDVGGVDGSLYLHGFSSGDKSHPRSEEICGMANCLGFEMKYLERKKDLICNITSNTHEILDSLSIES